MAFFGQEPSAGGPTASWRERWGALRRRRPAPAALAGDDDAAREARRTAFARIAAEHEAGLLRAARRMCRGNEDRAQDLAQDALVRAYEAYEHPTPFSPAQTRAWLLRILTNGFINEYRRRAKWEAGVDAAALAADGAAAPPALRADDSDTPGAALLTGTLDEPLERALAALPEAMRLCVLLVDVEGLDYAEAAQALSVPVGTVRSRLSRARLRLQTTLRDYALDRRLVP